MSRSKTHPVVLDGSGSDTDPGMPMPRIRKVRASEPWKRRTRLTRQPVTVTYDLARVFGVTS